MTGQPPIPEREQELREYADDPMPDWDKPVSDLGCRQMARDWRDLLDAARAEAREAEETCRQLAKRSAAHKREAVTLRAALKRIAGQEAVSGIALDLRHSSREAIANELTMRIEIACEALAGRETP